MKEPLPEGKAVLQLLESDLLSPYGFLSHYHQENGKNFVERHKREGELLRKVENIAIETGYIKKTDRIHSVFTLAEGVCSAEFLLPIFAFLSGDKIECSATYNAIEKYRLVCGDIRKLRDYIIDGLVPVIGMENDIKKYANPSYDYLFIMLDEVFFDKKTAKQIAAVYKEQLGERARKAKS